MYLLSDCCSDMSDCVCVINELMLLLFREVKDMLPIVISLITAKIYLLAFVASEANKLHNLP